jgi:DNA-binding NtrC family response regulator
MSVPTILIIDDDKLIRWSMSMLLSRAGFRVREAATGVLFASALKVTSTSRMIPPRSKQPCEGL